MQSAHRRPETRIFDSGRQCYDNLLMLLESCVTTAFTLARDYPYFSKQGVLDVPDEPSSELLNYTEPARDA